MAFGSIWKFGADNSEYKKAVREMPSEMDKSARQIESRTKEMGSKMSEPCANSPASSPAAWPSPG
jgi:hypothetical protein